MAVADLLALVSSWKVRGRHSKHQNILIFLKVQGNNKMAMVTTPFLSNNTLQIRFNTPSRLRWDFLIACLLPIVHHGARCSPGKHGKAAIWCKRKFAWSDQITLFHCAVVRFRPLLVLSAVKRGQYGHLDWPVVMQTHKQLTVMHCVFWQLSIKTSFLVIWATVAHLLDGTTWASSPHASVSSGHPWSCQWFTKKKLFLVSWKHWKWR